MPRMTQVYGVERISLLYGIVAYLMKENPVSLADLAKIFDYSEAEIESAVRSIGVADFGDNGAYFGNAFDIDYDLLESERLVSLDNWSVVLDAPRLTTKQTAAIAAGLRQFLQIPNFEFKDEVQDLLNNLTRGADSANPTVIALEPNPADADLALIREAIIGGKAISCDYINGKGERTQGRIIEPLRLESREQVWYLRGWCVSRNQAQRVFKLDAMDNVTILDREIDPSHLAEPLDDKLYVPGENAIDVVLEVEPEGYEVLADYSAEFSGALRGTVKATIRVGNLAALAPMVLSYGGAVRVLAPEQARAIVREQALLALGTPAKLSEEAE